MKNRLAFLALILIMTFSFSLVMAVPARAIIIWNTNVDIVASAAVVPPGGNVQLTISEENTGNILLEDISVTLYANDSFLYKLTKDSAGWQGYDPEGDSKLYKSEKWSWVITVPVMTATTFKAIGYGKDVPNNVVVTYPDYPDEMAEVKVETSPPGVATLTIGYWKNHRAVLQQCLQAGPISLGDTTISTVQQALAVLNNANAKDARDMLRAQLLGAILNLRNGASPMADGSDIRPVIESAKTFLATHTSPLLRGSPARDAALNLKDILEDFNQSSET